MLGTFQRSPMVRLRESLVRRFPSLSLSSWKFVDDPPSPSKPLPPDSPPLDLRHVLDQAADRRGINIRDFEEDEE